MKSIHLEIVTPVGMIFSNDVLSVVLPGSEGEFGVLPGHASLVTLLGAGVIDIQNQDDGHDMVAVDSGYVEVSENKVEVLAEGAELISGADDSAIAKSLEKAKALISKMGYDDSLLKVTMTKLESGAHK